METFTSVDGTAREDGAFSFRFLPNDQKEEDMREEKCFLEAWYAANRAATEATGGTLEEEARNGGIRSLRLSSSQHLS